LSPREEIRQQIWGDHTYVDFEQGLNFCVRQIRAALGDDAETPRYIETLPRRGCRFIAPVEEATGVGASGTPPPVARFRPYLRAPWIGGLGLISVLILIVLAYLAWQRDWIRPRSRAGRILIAVLPFQNLGGDREQEYLSDGLTEEMITRFGGYNPELLGVIASTSAMRYKGSEKGIDRIGRELGVDYVLEGSLRRAGDRVRVSAQLIRVRDQTHLWAQTYERNLQDVLALQAELARTIAGEISIHLKTRGGPQPADTRPIKAEAYEAYLKGRYFCRNLTGGGVEKGVEYFKQTIAQEPGYAPAYAALAEAYYALSNMQLNPRDAMAQAKAAAARALELDDSLAEAHAALGLVKAFYEWDWPGAEREFMRALELNPGWAGAQGWYGAYLALMGRLEESKDELERARRLDPLSLSINSTTGLPLYLEGQYDRAAEQMLKTVELDPNFYLAHVSLAWIFAGRKDLTTHPRRSQNLAGCP